jgi:hypothetical protein
VPQRLGASTGFSADLGATENDVLVMLSLLEQPCAFIINLLNKVVEMLWQAQHNPKICRTSTHLAGYPTLSQPLGVTAGAKGR